MTNRVFFSAATGAATAIVLATPALAQVTAAELWAEWQEQSVAMGQSITAASVSQTGNGLQLSGVTTTYADADVSVTSAVDQITMTENGDGTVAVTVSNPYRIRLQFELDEPGAPGTIEFTMTHDDLAITAGGTTGARSYAYTADEITITESEVSGGTETPQINVLFNMQDLAADYLIDGTDPDSMSFSTNATLGSFSGGVDIAPTNRAEGSLKATFQFDDMSTESSGSLGSLSALSENPESLPEGFAVASSTTYGAVATIIDFQEDSDTFDLSYANGGGNISFDISEASIGYGFAERGTDISISGSDIPIPIDVSMAGAEIRFDIPLEASATPSPFSARIAFEEVVMSDLIWGMADPSAAIPRDPVTAIADITGTARILMDLMASDPSSFDAPPAELRSLTINELRIAAAGAELTGTGDLEFAEGQVVPMPVGSVDLGLSGGMALLDQLQNTGLVPIEQIAMARGLAGAFARPGPTPDTLESTIEFTPGGGITANGVPLQ